MTGDQVLADPLFPMIKAMIIGHTGLAYYADRDGTLADSIARRIDEGGFASCSNYHAALLPSGGELDRLAALITIGETFFFRYPEQFEALRSVVLPECIRRRQGSRSLRIWSAGCSNGAEAYSIAILLHEQSKLADWKLSVLATDINDTFLDQARAGVFGDWALRGVDAERRDIWFEKTAQGRWRIRPVYARMVRFAHHNLVADPVPDPLNGLADIDVLFCRNVMIYFDRERRLNLLRRLDDSLAESGWLLVGHAEAGPEMNALFEPVEVPGATLYRRHGSRPPEPAPAWKPADLPASRPPPPATAQPAATPAAATPSDPHGDIRARHDEGEAGEALRLCDSAIAAAPLDAALHFLRGLFEEELGCGDSVAALRRAVYLDPDFSLAHYHLGLAYWRQGRAATSQRHFRTAWELASARDPDELVREGRGLTAGELAGTARLWFERSRS